MKLYKRVPKTTNCLYGSILIDENTNPFLEGPCLLCIAPSMTNNKSIFGISKEGMNLARLRVRNKENAGFDIKNFPVNFLSLKLETAKEDNTNKNADEQLQEFVKKYFIPLISNRGMKIDVNIAMKNMRNVNIMSYCDGTLIVQDIENLMLDKMKQLGYTDKECKLIQSQMFMMPIATNRLDGRQKSTCVSFRDINDEELYNPSEDELADKMEKLPIKEMYIKKSDTELEYLIWGEGKHDLKMQGQNGKAFRVSMSSVITNALENSIKNFQSTEEFIPINMEELTRDLENIMKNAEEGIDASILMQKLDKKLNYGNAKRLTEYEVQLLDQLDEICNSQIKSQQELSSLQPLYEKNRTKLKMIYAAIEKNCSVDMKKILLSGTGYQIREDDEHTKKAEKLQQSIQESQSLDEKINEIKEKSKEK